jgi:hypothetical protein
MITVSRRQQGVRAIEAQPRDLAQASTEVQRTCRPPDRPWRAVSPSSQDCARPVIRGVNLRRGGITEPR